MAQRPGVGNAWMGLWLVASLVYMPSGWADPGPLDPVKAFRQAENEFRYQDYEQAVSLLRPLLYPQVQLEAADVRILAREYLAASHWWRKNLLQAREEFTALLVEAPDHALDPFYYPAPLVAFLEDLRKELRSKGILDAPRKDSGPLPDEVLLAPATVPWSVNLLPFGVPQFNYGYTTRGWFLAVGQGASLVTNLVTSLMIEDLRGSDGLFASADAGTARSLRNIWWTSTGVLTILYAFGVVDGFLHQPVSRPPPKKNDTLGLWNTTPVFAPRPNPW